jgi:SagB-type dehydrogenase family enzyme
MKKIFCITTLLLLCSFTLLNAQEFTGISLIAPQTDGGKPLMKALNERKSTRSFENKMLSDQQLSNLLWAAFGINRSAEGKRTAPSAMNKQEIDIYVVLEKGIYIYNAEKNFLTPVASGDFRKVMGKQDFVATAPVVLVFVADYDKMSGEEKDKNFYGAVDTGYISQNVYLFCASENLGTVVLGYIDRDAMAPVLKLKSNQKVVLSQGIGFPK